MLNRNLLLALIFSIPVLCFSQTEDHKNQLGISLSAADFNGPLTGQYFKFERYHGLGRIYYSRYLNSSFNLKLDLSAIKVLHPKEIVYPEIEEGIYTLERFFDAGLKIEYKLDNGYIFRDDAIIGPYLTTGLGFNILGGNETPEDWNTYVPFGIGFNIRPADKFTINLQAEYKLNLDNSFDYTQFSGGLAYNFGKQANKEIPVVDTDNDGIPDDSDECPFAYGIIDYFGCPDTDGDGIGDSRDKCPFDAGKNENKGCPVMDKDKDGIPDEKDACPEEAGKAENRGCPDQDNDGIIDKEDECPEIAGPIDNNGCPLETEPELTETYSIYFDGSSARVREEGEKVLDNVAGIMNSNPTYTLKIKGHTCTVGTDEKNVDLSLERAESAWEYIVQQGVEGKRMSIYGYGEYDPKYNPDQASKNRRVDLEIYK